MDRKKIRESLLEGLVEKMLDYTAKGPMAECEPGESEDKESKEDSPSASELMAIDPMKDMKEKPKASIEIVSIEGKPKAGSEDDENYIDDLLPPKKKKA